MASRDFLMIEPTGAAFRAADEREGTVNDLRRRLWVVGRGNFQAKHARQQRAVVTFEG